MKHPNLLSANDYKAIDHALSTSKPLVLTRTLLTYSIIVEVVKTGEDEPVWHQSAIIRVTQNFSNMTTYYQHFRSVDEMKKHI